MNSHELAEQVQILADAAKDRILTVGHEQYSDGDQQKFEQLPLNELFAWLQEELQDVVSYAAMLSVRVERVRRALETIGSLGEQQ